MRVLVVADIHGNHAALEAIRAVRRLRVSVTSSIKAPALRQWVRALYCVRGNHDHGVAQDVAVTGVAGFRFLTSITRPLTVAALSANQRRYLADLPTSRMFVIGGKTYLLVHATPRDPMDEYATADKSFWTPRLQGLHVDYVLAGHTHQPYTLQVNGTLIINPGSVGLNRGGDHAPALSSRGDNVELKRQYRGQRSAAWRKIEDPTAREMLTDIYRGGPYISKWFKNGNGNGSNGNGKHV